MYGSKATDSPSSQVCFGGPFWYDCVTIVDNSLTIFPAKGEFHSIHCTSMGITARSSCLAPSSWLPPQQPCKFSFTPLPGHLAKISGHSMVSSFAPYTPKE
ncbi:hypothetical protein VTP01DRAFT_1858 [Rhizomucor pusillus]|uniref:uncharacterized protein n=1 Tax=Rhizomucor pusillus TaxID=4840 RepID=UPI003744302C